MSRAILKAPPLALAAAFLMAAPATAQTADPGAGKVARAVRVVGPSPHIDGHLDDPVWATANWFSDFTQKVPVEGGVPTDRTEVAFAYDDAALYVGARLYSSRVAEIPRPVTRRDQFSNAEYFIVALDPYHDKRTGYSFSISSGGVQGDSYHPQDEEDNRDPAFNPVWEAQIQFDSLGWYVEMRIPFSQLRFNRQAVQEWGLNINRWRPGFNEDIYWVMIPLSTSGFFSHFGTLIGMDKIVPSRRAEVIPYVASTASFSGASGAGNPFNDGSTMESRAGGDIKAGLGSNLTLDATVNPDFGQVEADPAVVNLTAFETFFPEQRPFFVEGNQLLQGNGPGYYYSRRIGGAPQGSATAEFVDAPSYATIIGAAKLTGRTSSGMSVGALTALTQREYAQTYDSSTSTFGKVAVEPMTAYLVGRAQQEFGKSASTIGVTLTGLARSFNDAPGLADQMNSQAASGGVDWLLRLRNGEYQLSGYAGFSHIRGTESAVALVQESSAHYFQRPDQGYATFDPTRTSLSGYTAALSADKTGGKHWTGGAVLSTESPGFELNDVGRLSSADDIDASAYVNFRQNSEGRVFRRYRLGAALASGWNYGGTRTYSVYRLNTNYTWKNWWNTYIGVFYRPRSTSDDLTRGGPLMGTLRSTGVDFSGFGNEAKSTTVGVNFGGQWNELGASSTYVNVRLGARPGSRWQLSVAPNWQHAVNAQQYIGLVDGGTPATYGGRYIFSWVDQTTLSMQLRLNYSFTPRLTLEVYAEPFASSGNFSRYGELTAAGASTLRTYGTDNTTIVADPSGNYQVTDANNGQTFPIANNDFNVLSYRSNVVMRWEWRPGSALFLIWQQNRSSNCSAGYDTGMCYQPNVTPGSGLGLGDLAAARGAPGDNVVVVKATYWLSVH
jgi:hypothetical protein